MRILKTKYNFQVIVSGIFKGVSVILNLWQISLLYHLLNTTEFSIWVTIISITNWLLLFDIGIGNSLRNKVSLLIHTEKENIAFYISNAYTLTLFVVVILSAVNFLFYVFFDWNAFFNTNKVTSKTLGLTTFWAVFAVTINQFFSLISQLYHSLQKSELASLHSVILNFCFSCFLFFYGNYLTNLFYLSFIYLLSIIISGIIVTYIFFSRYSEFRPSLSKVSLTAIIQLANLGFILLFIEIAPLILNFSNNIFIAKNIGIEFVGGVNIVFRIFFSITTTSWIIIVPFWAYTSEKMVKKEYDSIRNRLKKIQIVMVPLSFLLIVVSYFFDEIIYLWLRKRIHVDNQLLFYMSIFVLLSFWNTIYIFLFNGLNKYKYNLMYPFSIVLLNWPISYWLSVIHNLGVVGVIQSSIICMIPYSLYSFILSKSFFKK
jgi:O-antigen/teichoic acid export membrane protein